jgi:hypothetical protein
MQLSPARPPYGMSNDNETSLSAARKDNLAQSISTFLSERNVVLEEILQTKKEAKLIQSESRRGQEEIVRRLSVFESRILAFEALSRTMDRRTAGCESLMLQLQSDFELRLRNIDSEGARHRREHEVNLRALVETVSARTSLSPPLRFRAPFPILKIPPILMLATRSAPSSMPSAPGPRRPTRAFATSRRRCGRTGGAT